MIKTILLTWTIDPNKNVDTEFKNTIIRYHEYIYNIIYLLFYWNFENIVFCENSWYEIIGKDKLFELAKILNKNLEIIQFKWNTKMTLEKWHGFGEQEIIEYAVKNSKYINAEKIFMKITGRYRFVNINQINEHINENKPYFLKIMPSTFEPSIKIKKINTWLFISTVDFFEKYLIWAGKDVDDVTNNKSLESVYYDRIINNKRLTNYMPIWPRFTFIGKPQRKLEFLETFFWNIWHNLWWNKIR